MMRCVWLLCVLVLGPVAAVHYEPTWESLDSRPLPAWYDDVKFGIFIHWGVFSVPSFGSEWFWHYWQTGNPQYVNFMKRNYPPGWTYADFAPQFTAEFYDPDHWADVIEASGAKYVVLTSKHHEGFCNWATNASFNWNSMAVGPKRDLVGDLAKAIGKKKDLHFGLYHSLFEWYNPLYLQDKANDFKTQNFVKSKTMAELYEIVNAYHPEVLWSDGDAGPVDYWTSKEFLAWLYNDSPVKDTVVTNDRWGTGCACKHGGYYTCQDRYNPGVVQKHKWENCMTIDRNSWGYRRNTNLANYLNTHELITTLAETVSCGGNLLMNIGPTHDGRIVPIFEERLRDVGSWLKVNGEAIYGSQPWTHQNDTVTKNVWYTSKPSSHHDDHILRYGFKATNNSTNVYAIMLDWPSNNSLVLGAVSGQAGVTTVTMLGLPAPLKWLPAPGKGGVEVALPATLPRPCQWAWVLKIEGAASRGQ